VDGGGRDSGVKLPEIVAAFSLASDLGLGQPMEHVLRSWLIAARLGDRLGLDPAERGALYYVSTLAWVGCVADTPEVAAWFGDDIGFRSGYYDVDLAGLPMLGFMLRHVGAGNPALYRLRLGAKLVVTGGKGIQQGLMSHCLTTARMAERFGLDDEHVCQPLQQVFARWDGKGVPQGMSGEDIALPMRLFALADMVEVHHRTGGPDAAIEVARAKRGKHFDPAVVDAFCKVAAEVLGDPAEEHDWPTLIESEPSLQRRLTEAELNGALEAIADFRPAVRASLRSLPRSRWARRARRRRAWLAGRRRQRGTTGRVGPRSRDARGASQHSRQVRSIDGAGERAAAHASVLHAAHACAPRSSQSTRRDRVDGA
jgi:hypothetical protein